MIRKINGKLIGLALKATGCGFRFSKDYRWGTTVWHRIVYRCVDTVGANLTAGLDLTWDIAPGR